MQSNILTLCCIASALLTVRSQHLTSPCPNVFRYEPKTESDRWYGVIQLSTDVELHSIWIDIELDRPAHILGVSEDITQIGTRLSGDIEKRPWGYAIVYHQVPIFENTDVISNAF